MPKKSFKIHYGEQNTTEWETLKIGKFSSSTMNQLFVVPSKQSKAKTAMRALRRDEWTIKQEIAESRPNNEEMNYCIKYLLDYSFGKKAVFEAAKAELKATFKDKSFDWSTFHNFGLSTAAKLILRGCYAIEKTEVLQGTAIGLIKRKVQEIIHDTLTPSPTSKAIDWGNENEPLASMAFVDKTCLFVDEGLKKVSFIEMSSAEGSSPDDTINGCVPVEYKCPFNRSIHYDHCLIRTAHELFKYDTQKYYQQQHQMAAMQATHGYWNSFDPRLLQRDIVAHRAMHTIKIKPNHKVIKQMRILTDKAVRMRDKLVNEFINTNDTALWDF